MKKILALLLSLALFVSLAAPAFAAGSTTPTFTDVPTTHWAYSYVEEMVAKGVVNGVGNNLFAPSKAVSTAEFATMITRAFYPGALADFTLEEQYYEDPEAWWVPYIDVASRNGLLFSTVANAETNNHMSNGGTGWFVYQWGDFVTVPMSRYDMASVIYNLMVAKKETMPTESERMAAQSQIGDWSQVPKMYQTAVTSSYAAGILNGKDGGVFAGDDTMTRAEAATVMSRLFAYGIEPDEETPTPAATPEPTPTLTPTTGGEKDVNGYTTANSVNSVKSTVGKSDAYKTMGGATFFANSESYIQIGKVEGRIDYYGIIEASQTVSNNGYFTGANVDIGNAKLEYDFLALVNEARKAEGLNELQWVPSDAAEEYTLLRAHELTTYFAHSREGGLISLEVIANGIGNVQSTFNAWMNSAGHKQTLMAEDRLYLCAAREKDKWIITVWDRYATPNVEWAATDNYNWN